MDIDASLDDMLAGSVVKMMPQIMAIKGFIIPKNSDQWRAFISHGITSANSEFAVILARVKAKHPKKRENIQ
jgi:hypothetical protein